MEFWSACCTLVAWGSFIFKQWVVCWMGLTSRLFAQMTILQPTCTLPAPIGKWYPYDHTCLLDQPLCSTAPNPCYKVPLALPVLSEVGPSTMCAYVSSFYTCIFGRYRHHQLYSPNPVLTTSCIISITC